MSELENHDAMDVEMDELEQALTEALRRVDAPEGFAEKVMERTVGAEPPAVAKVVAMPQRHGSLRMRAWVGGAIAAALALGMFGAEQLHQRRERAEKAAVCEVARPEEAVSD